MSTDEGMVASTHLQRGSKLVVSATILGLSLYFIGLNLHFFTLTRESLGKYFDIKWILLLHVSGGAVALLSGPFQFWDRLRIRRRALHRGLGMAYVLAVAASAPCAVYLSFTTAYEVGRPYAFSLHAWAGVWIVSTWLAYRYARLEKFKLHEEWMVRSYLVTLAFVLSALLAKVPLVARQGSFADVSPGIFWAGWALPLFAWDVVLSRRRKQ